MSMLFVYLHAAAMLIWIAVNLGILPIRPFDPKFVILAMVASVEALFLTPFLLIHQNRMQRKANQRVDIDLHCSRALKNGMLPQKRGFNQADPASSLFPP